MLNWLVFRPVAMSRNSEHSGRLIVAEAVMLALVPFLGRLKAHDLVYATCRHAIDSNQTLFDVLRGDPKDPALLDKDVLLRLTIPVEYLAIALEMVDRVLERR